jgi:hypothetical protein
MSQFVPTGRVTPFWDVLLTGAAAHAALLPVLIAGLPGLRGKYAGEPVKAPNNGSVLLTDPFALANPQEAPESMFVPVFVIVPPQLFGVPAFRIVFLKATVPALRNTFPPVPVVVLPENVLLTIVVLPFDHRPPPLRAAPVTVLPEMVEFPIVTVAGATIPVI